MTAGRTARAPVPGSDDDAGLLRRIADGDPAAFAILVNRHQGPFYRVARRMLGDEGDAEDCVQIAFLRIHRRAADFDPRFAPSTWLYRVLTNACIDAWRRAGREIPTEAPEPEAGHHDPVERLDLDAAIGALSTEARIVLLLRAGEGLSYQEIARIRGVSVNTIKTQLGRARRAIRRFLEEDQR